LTDASFGSISVTVMVSSANGSHSSDPTVEPTNAPTVYKSTTLSLTPSASATLQPSNSALKPSPFPTIMTSTPSSLPTSQPSITTSVPSTLPTSEPTIATSQPSFAPSAVESAVPSVDPTRRPTSSTKKPSPMPTFNPTTSSPTLFPSSKPTVVPSSRPSLAADETYRPTVSMRPSNAPSTNPTTIPTASPTLPPKKSETSATLQIGGLPAVRRRLADSGLTAAVFLSDPYNSAAFCDAMIGLVSKSFDSGVSINCRIDNVTDVVTGTSGLQHLLGGGGIVILYTISVTVPSSVVIDIDTVVSLTETAIVTSTSTGSVANAFDEQLDLYGITSTALKEISIATSTSLTSVVLSAGTDQPTSLPTQAPSFTSSSAPTTATISLTNGKSSGLSTSRRLAIIVGVSVGGFIIIVATLIYFANVRRAIANAADDKLPIASSQADEKAHSDDSNTTDDRIFIKNSKPHNSLGNYGFDKVYDQSSLMNQNFDNYEEETAAAAATRHSPSNSEGFGINASQAMSSAPNQHFETSITVYPDVYSLDLTSGEEGEESY
jgi:hypothetical protein